MRSDLPATADNQNHEVADRETEADEIGQAARSTANDRQRRSGRGTLNTSPTVLEEASWIDGTETEARLVRRETWIDLLGDDAKALQQMFTEYWRWGHRPRRARVR